MINPGTGPIEVATREHADANMKIFCEEVGIATEAFRHAQGEYRARKEGLWTYVITGNGRDVPVDMPGLPIEQVRYAGPPQNPFAFPRLYVDGNSWLWEFAVSQARLAARKWPSPSRTHVKDGSE